MLRSELGARWEVSALQQTSTRMLGYRRHARRVICAVLFWSEVEADAFQRHLEQNRPATSLSRNHAAIQLPWKPSVTRCDSSASAIGPSASVMASKMARSLRFSVAR